MRPGKAGHPAAGFLRQSLRAHALTTTVGSIMTALTLATSTGPMMMRTGPMVMRTGPPVRVRLPAGGWHVVFWAQPGGRTAVEVTDPAGSTIGWAASTLLPAVSIDAAWSGWVRGSEGSRQCWALAIGHAPAEPDQPTVTFSRRTRGSRSALPRETVDGLWVAHDGLWVAATTGRYTHVRLTARSATHTRRLSLVMNPPGGRDGVAGTRSVRHLRVGAQASG